jgi:hypothetical protein
MEEAKHPTSNIQHPTPNDDWRTRNHDSGAAWLLREANKEEKE